MTLSNEGLTAWESAAAALLREKQIRARWDANEFWGVLASLTVAGSRADNPMTFVERNVELLRTIGPALTVLLIANVTWNRPPLTVGNAIIGDADAAFLALVNASADSRVGIGEEVGKSWLKEQVQPRLTKKGGIQPVAIACWSPGHLSLAAREAERQLRNLVDLTVLLERDLKAHRVYGGSDINRPGIRGLTLDRGAVDRGLVGSARLELASFPLTISDHNSGRQTVEWFSADPLPLGELLDQQYLREAVQSCLQPDPISNRIRVAARWFAEAFYTFAKDDAVLALGVAMGAMLSGHRSLPGSAMADRFALLSEDPKERRKLVTNYLDFYGVRSSVAHGGRSGKLDREDFHKQYQDAVHWAAWRSLALRDAFTPSSEKEVDALFDELRWGARGWS